MNEAERLDAADRWFAVNLKDARERAGLSQEGVAARMREGGHAGFRQQTVGRIEAGERSVRVGEALSLARVLGTNLDALARAPEVTRDAAVLRGAAMRLREAMSAERDAGREVARARELLEGALSRAKESRNAGALGEEIRVAGRVLAEAVTPGDEARKDSGDVSGTSETVR